MTEPQRTILHVDMDAFYASVEQRDFPEYRGKPLIVGGTARRGVVSTCSYEARVFGVRSAMPMYEAKKKCPQAIVVFPRISHYAEVSAQLMEIFGNYSPEVEPLSLDEAFLDMSGAHRLFGTPRQMAEKIQQNVKSSLNLTCSIGAASTKYVAKVASDLNKPFGITICEPGTEREFLAPLTLRKLWGVGPKSAEQLEAAGLRTIGDVASWPEPNLRAKFGSFGTHIWQLASGIDPRVVDSQRERHSLGSERTLDTNISGAAEVRRLIVPLADEVARGLRAKGVRAHGVRLKLRYATFQLVTRDLRLAAAALDSASLLSAFDELLLRVETDLPIRLVGISAFDLVADENPHQLDLFSGNRVKREKLESALDSVNEKFGKAGIVRGSRLKKE